MKIGSIEIKPPQPATTAGATPAAERKPTPTPDGGPSPAATPAAEASAQVALSPAAGILGSNATEAATDPTFDKAKVERIAQAIRDGKFTVNAEAIADKLIVNAEELLGRKPS